jgi:lipopolysaccharide transport system ATP-binding protein
MEEKTSIPVLEVKQLSKLYYKDQRMHDSIREEVVDGVKSLFRRRKIEAGADQFWALKEVSFQLEKGDVLGIIGPNGAGKSTLLKILSEVTAPSSGEIHYQGELTPILEIGTGFHPDLSGRENIFLNGAVLGMSKQEIQARLPDILAFSGVEDFIDSPVKHYSSGMFLRLAFSIAFHADVDILVLDEVLAVGDAAFQRKSFDRIRALALSGSTIILASHTNRQILELCNKCLWLEKGEVRAFGKTKSILEEYLEEVLEEQQQASEASEDHAPPSEKQDSPDIEATGYRLAHVRAAAKGKEPTVPIYNVDTIELEISIQKYRAQTSMEIGIRLLNIEGIYVLVDSYSMRTSYQPQKIGQGAYIIRAEIPGNLLNAGLYTLNVIAAEDGVLKKEWPVACKFRINLSPDEEGAKWVNHAILAMPLRWEVTKESEDYKK